jgi:hypothetical protein
VLLFVSGFKCFSGFEEETEEEDFKDPEIIGKHV